MLASVKMSLLKPRLTMALGGFQQEEAEPSPQEQICTVVIL